MARIALIAGMAVLGAIVSVATGGLGTFAVGAWAADIFAGASVGAMAGSVLASVIFPPKGAVGPQLNDRQVMSSAPGMPIPWGYGSYRIAGNVIWAAQIKESTQKQSQSGKGGGPQSTTYIYTVSAAISFGYGPGKITRLWADSKLIYDITGKTPIAIDSGWTHSNGQQITSPFNPVIYTGSATQTPDPTIQARLGAAATPAFRDQIYIVVNDFPLADFGNRMPNFRAEISVGSALSYIKDSYPPNGVIDPYWTGTPISAPFVPIVDSLNRVAYIGTVTGGVLQKVDINVDSGAALASHQTSTLYYVGQQVLDSNGNVQVCVESSAPHQSGSSNPSWFTGEYLYTNDNDLKWLNLGPGPTAVAMLNFGQAISIILNAGASEVMFAGFTVDTAGYPWICLFENTGIGPGAYVMMRLDSTSFGYNGKSVDLGSGAIKGCIPVKSSVTGKNYIYCLVQGSFVNSLIVIDADAGKISASGSYLTAAQSGAGAALSCNHVAVDISTGDCYVLANKATGGGHYTTYLNKLSPQSGIVVTTNIAALPDTLTPYTGVWGSDLWWCAQDKTILIQTSNNGGNLNASQLWKVNPSSGAVLDTLGGLYSSQGMASGFTKAYGGLVPTDGVIKLIRTNLTSGFDFVYINASTLQVEKTASISNWINGGTAGHYPFGASYDALTDSMLMCIDSFNITFRIFFDRVGVGASLLSDVITDVWTKSGADVSLLDVSLVTGVQVRGYPITTVSNGKGILQPLCTAYFFDMVESDNLLVAVPRGQTVSTTIPETDLGLIGDQYKAMPTVMQENDLPRSITVSYYDQTLDYQTGKQMFQRNARVKKTRNQTNIGLPLTLQPDEAAHISWKALATAWAERNQWEFRLWRPSYLIIDPTDVIAFTYNGQQYTCRVSKHQIGQNLVLQVTAASENSAQYIPSNSGAGIDGFVTGTIKPLGPTLLLALDIPFVQDIDAVASGFEGYYWAAGSPTGTGWPGGQLFVSPDNQTWAGQGTDTSAATYGVVVTATPAPLTKYAWDYKTTINVRIVEGTLSSNSLVNVLNGTNWFYLGGEIMAFLNATLNADGSYTLDTLLRGLRGTEGWTGTHAVGETFLVLDDSLQHQIISSSYIGALQYIRGVTIGQAVSTSTSQQLTLQGNDLKPYAPAQFTGSVDGSSNIVASWVRRTRIGGAWLDSTGSVPISEQSESYDIAIYNSTGATLKRLVTGLTSPTFTYTAAMQTTDFGSTQASVYAIVWQNSAVVGHGFPATNPTLGSGNVVSGGSDATSILGVTITGTPADGDILQYNAGANAWEIVPFPGGTSTRTTTSKTTASLAAGASETGTWATGTKTSILLEIVASGIARVQLYSTAAFRDADNGRVFGAPPANGVESGILADFNLDTGDPSTGVATFICSPPLIASNMDGATTDQMYYRITNMTGGTTTITATLTILPLEA